MSNIIEYEKRVCLFLDILGFKEIVEGKQKKTPQEIAKIIKVIKDDFNLRVPSGNKRNITQFSDCIVVSIETSESYGTTDIICLAKLLQCNLFANYNMPLRGGIYIDELVHTDEYLFGKAMNEAYKLESKFAIAPRIIFNKENYEQIHRDEREQNSEWLKEDSDGYLYIDYFTYAKDKDSEEIKEFYSILKTNIEENLKGKTMPVIQKYLWMKEKYNMAIKDFIFLKGMEIND